jgi:hypothetical protein
LEDRSFRDDELVDFTAVHDDPFLKSRIEDFEAKAQMRVEEYNAVFLPWGPNWNGEDIEEQLSNKCIFYSMKKC